MGSVASVALWLAAGLAALVLLALLYVLARRLVAHLFHRKLRRQVDLVQKVINEHEKGQFEAVDRLLFQLGQVQDQQAIELGLSQALDRGVLEMRPRLRKIYDSLGMTKRYLDQLESSSKWAERMAAARILGQLGAVEAIPLLVSVLRDPHEDPTTVKLAAAQALGLMKAEQAIPLLLGELRDGDDWASPRLAELLVSFGEKARDALRDALQDQDHVNARVWAAQILGRSQDRSAVPLLMTRLSDRSERVRISAAEALGRLADKQALDALVQVAMRDPVSPVRAEAARALGEIGDEAALENLVMLLASHDYWTRLRAIEAIEMLRPADTSMLEQALSDGAESVRNRAAVALERVGALQKRLDQLGSTDRQDAERASEILVKFGQAGLLESMLGALESEDMRLRARICEVLGAIGDARAVESVAKALADTMWPVRVRAIEAIKALRPPEGVTLILACLSDEEETVRVAAVDAIHTLGVPAGDDHVHQVVRLYTAGNAAVRCSVIEAIGSREREEVDELLSEALTDPNAEVRVRAVRAVSIRNKPRWTQPLITCLTDAESRVRSAAAEGLGRIGSREALRAVISSIATPDRAFRESLTTVLAAQGAHEIIKMSASARSSEHRLALIWALGKTGDSGALDALVDWSGDDDASIRAAAAGAVAKLSDPRSEQVLERLLKDPNERVRAAAVNGLGQLGASSALDTLVRAMDDPDEFVRNRVAIAIGRLGGGNARALAGLDYAFNRSREPKVRAYALVGYGLLGNEMGFRIALLGLSDPAMQPHVMSVLEREPPDVQQRFREALNLERSSVGTQTEAGPFDSAQLEAHYVDELRHGQDPERRLNAIKALQALGISEQLDVLLGVVRTDPDPRVRCLALTSVLDHIDDVRVPDLLVSALGDPVVDVQLQAARGLASLADPRHNDALLRCLVLQNERLRPMLVEALAKANAANVIAFIDKLMGETRKEVLCGGAAVLGMIADPKAEGVLIAWLDTRDPEMRAEVITSLGKLGTMGARDALVDCLSDPNEGVRLSTLSALSSLPGTAAPLLRLCQDPSTRVREHLARMVGESRSVESLRLAETLVVDPDFSVREEALKSLLLLGDWSAVERFVEHFSKQPFDMQHRLKQLPPEHPVHAAQTDLLLNSRHPEARQVAIKALALLGQRPLPVLLQALADPDPGVRIAAVEAAGYASEPVLRAAIDQLLRDPVESVRQAARRGRMLVIDGDKEA